MVKATRPTEQRPEFNVLRNIADFLEVDARELELALYRLLKKRRPRVRGAGS